MIACPVVVRWRLVVAVTAAVKNKRHQANAADEREYDAKKRRNPAMDSDRRVTAFRQAGIRVDSGRHEYRKQREKCVSHLSLLSLVGRSLHRPQSGRLDVDKKCIVVDWKRQYGRGAFGAEFMGDRATQVPRQGIDDC